MLQDVYQYYYPFTFSYSRSKIYQIEGKEERTLKVYLVHYDNLYFRRQIISFSIYKNWIFLQHDKKLN